MGVFGFGNKKKQQREERIEEMRIQIEKDSTQIKERLLALKVGNELNFGQYYYDDYVYKDISWKVLDIIAIQENSNSIDKNCQRKIISIKNVKSDFVYY